MSRNDHMPGGITFRSVGAAAALLTLAATLAAGPAAAEGSFESRFESSMQGVLCLHASGIAWQLAGRYHVSQEALLVHLGSGPRELWYHQ